MFKFLSRIFKKSQNVKLECESQKYDVKDHKEQDFDKRISTPKPPVPFKRYISDLDFYEEEYQIDGTEFSPEEFYRRKSHACSMEEATGWRNDPDYFSYKHKKDHQLIK